MARLGSLEREWMRRPPVGELLAAVVKYRPPAEVLLNPDEVAEAIELLDEVRSWKDG